MQQNPSTAEELLDAAKVAEATEMESGPSISSKILDAINRIMRRTGAALTSPPPCHKVSRST